jgi:hypothetical protein
MWRLTKKQTSLSHPDDKLHPAALRRRSRGGGQRAKGHLGEAQGAECGCNVIAKFGGSALDQGTGSKIMD